MCILQVLYIQYYSIFMWMTQKPYFIQEPKPKFQVHRLKTYYQTATELVQDKLDLAYSNNKDLKTQQWSGYQ